MVTFEYFPTESFFGESAAYYCFEHCWSEEAGWNENVAMSPAVSGSTYDIGADGGQLVYALTAEEAQLMGQAGNLEAYMAAFWSWFYTYYDWYAAGDMLGHGYGWDDLVTKVYIDRPEEATTVTFTEMPLYGWLGKCYNEGCAGETEVPTGITTGYAYNTDDWWFVYYLTEDAFQEGTTDMKEELLTQYYYYFPWMDPSTQGPAPPDASGIAAILAAIGADPAPLTITLIWNDNVDLDLHFYCDDGTEIFY